MSGCLVLLVDESAAMGSRFDKTSVKSKAESIATSINALLGKLSKTSAVDIALLGYRSGANDAIEVGSRWGGALAGRDFVAAPELAAAPLVVEQRRRTLPGPSGTGNEELFEFPVWYQPAIGNKAPQVAAFQRCHELLSSRPLDGPVFIVNFASGGSADGNPLRAVQKIQQLTTSNGPTVVVQVQLTSSHSLPPTLYPSNPANLKPGLMRDIFQRTSPLPPAIIEGLQKAGVALSSKARAMIYNAQMIDVTRLLNVIRVQLEPALPAPAAAPAADAAPETPSAPAEAGALPADAIDEVDSMLVPATPAPVAEGAVPELPTGCVSADFPLLVLLVLDRSLSDPYAPAMTNAFTLLRDAMGDMLERIVKMGDGGIDVGIVSYGDDGLGSPDIRTALEGALAGQYFVRDDQILDQAVRIDKFDESRSNGVGGLLTIQHARPILVELDPAPAAAAAPAFAEAAGLISTWSADHPTSPLPPVVIHLSRGAIDAAGIADAREQLAKAGDQVVLYHYLRTEAESPALVCPDTESAIDDPGLAAIWQSSSRLMYGAQLAEDKPDVSPQARGFVVNGPIDLLVDFVKRATRG